MLGTGKRLKLYSVGAIGRSTRPQHIQDAYIAAAQAKRVRRAAKPGASAYALANLNRA
jgi:hypothetical protein